MFSSIWQLSNSISIDNKYALSIKYIYPSYACVYIHIDILCQVNQCDSPSSLHFLFLTRATLHHYSRCIIACLSKSTNQWRNAIKAVPLELSGPQRGYKATARYAVQYQEGAQGQYTLGRAISRGGVIHTSS